jgi:deoxyribonuclease V
MWPTTIPEAIALQNELRSQLVLHDDFGELRTVAGVDAGFEDEGTTTRAAVVVLSFPELQPIDYATVREPTVFPYVPGLLSFREAPALLSAISLLKQPPGMLICDGQGIAHPRRLGIAAHLGLVSGIPAIGCAKSLLCGYHGELPPEKGAQVALYDRKEQIGVVLRTRDNTKPVYVSPGHRVSMDSAVEIVLRCTTRYRLPETTRYAHNLASHGTVPIKG